MEIISAFYTDVKKGLRIFHSEPQTVKKLIHCEREGSGVEGTPEFIPQAEFISAEENPVFLRPDKVQGFPQK